MDKKELARSVYSMIPEINHRLFRQNIKTDFPKQQIRLLHMLKHHNNKPMKFFSDNIPVSKPNLTKLVDPLIEKGMIERKRSSEDRRIVLLSITELGLQVLAKEFELILEETGKLFEVFTDEDAQAILHHMEELSKLFGKIESKGMCNEK